VEDPTANITDNSINNFDMGIDLYENADVTITGNTITNCDYGIKTNNSESEAWAQSVVAHYNNIVENIEYGIDNSVNSATFDATENWWGNASGPRGGELDPCENIIAAGTGDRVSSNVCFYPWSDSQ